MKPTDFALYLTKYLSQYLPGQSGASKNTVQSYRDTFSLLLSYCQEEKHISPQKLTLVRLDRLLIEQFLMWLEDKRNCCAGTRNNRLAAIHAFYRYLQIENPQMIQRCQEILSIPYKKAQQKVMTYLTLDGIKALLAQPDTNTKSGRRDVALLSLLYDTGARVQELVDLKLEDIRFSSPTVIRLTGKGKKVRMKPVRLFAYQVANSTLRDAVVLDLFAGSGTTAIACEQLGRAACLMESDPRFVDVILRRWEAFTGEKAVLLHAC